MRPPSPWPRPANAGGVPPALRDFFEEPAAEAWPGYAGLLLCFLVGLGAGVLLTLRVLRADRLAAELEACSNE